MAGYSGTPLARRLGVRPGGSRRPCGHWLLTEAKRSGVDTDITEDVVHDVALPTGMVDNKVCAIDDTWSGLRLVLRKELSPGRTKAAG